VTELARQTNELNSGLAHHVDEMVGVFKNLGSDDGVVVLFYTYRRSQTRRGPRVASRGSSSMMSRTRIQAKGSTSSKTGSPTQLRASIYRRLIRPRSLLGQSTITYVKEDMLSHLSVSRFVRLSVNRVSQKMSTNVHEIFGTKNNQLDSGDLHSI